MEKLGYIMLEIVPNDLEHCVTEVLRPADAYTSHNPKFGHIKGIVARQPHVTLLYGALLSGTELEKHAVALLDCDDFLPRSVEIERIDAFESRQDGEEYYCIVAHLKLTPELRAAHERLKVFPHTNTLREYKPHMSLAYIHKEEDVRDAAVAHLNASLRGRCYSTGKIFLGEI